MKRLLNFTGFKLNEASSEIINLVGDLKQGNPYWPKIPVKNVFLNPNVYDRGDGMYGFMSKIQKGTKEYIDNDKFDEFPIEEIDIKNIVPTQKFLSADNLETVDTENDVIKSTIIKDGDEYFVIDGHHRIAMRILMGETKIKSHVYTTR